MFHVNPHQPGAQIHSSDPFATPEQDKSPVRRLRGRLAAGVTLWTTTGPAGLTVSSMMVADGDWTATDYGPFPATAGTGPAAGSRKTGPAGGRCCSPA